MLRQGMSSWVGPTCPKKRSRAIQPANPVNEGANEVVARLLDPRTMYREPV